MSVKNVIIWMQLLNSFSEMPFIVDVYVACLLVYFVFNFQVYFLFKYVYVSNFNGF